MSNEWLTTGQMIDRLKVGEVAQKQNADTCIKRVTSALYKYCLANGDTSGFREVTLDSMIVGHKWRLIPNYVSFEEAMKALKEGKTVEFHPTIKANRKIFLSPTMLDDILDDLLVSQYSLKELLNGQWTIEAETP